MNPYRNRKLWKAHCVAAVALTAALAGTGGTSLLPGVCLWAGEISSSQVNQEPVESSDGQIAQDGGASPGSALIEDSGHAVQNDSGVSMDELQKAMDSGDQDALRRIAEGETGSGVGGEGSQSETAVPEPEIPGMADPESVRQLLQALSAYDSMTGSDDELRAADYIAGKMKEYGYTVETQPFHEGFVDETGNDEQGLNIIAERGADSETNRTDGIFLVVTHYDTKRKKEKGDPFTADRTGACALLETARVLQNIKTDTDICFVFLSGEEDGLYGSKHFVNTLSDEMKARIRGVLDVERVGYVPETFCVLANSDGQDNDVTTRVRQAAFSIREEAAAAVPDGIQAENETAAADGGVRAENAPAAADGGVRAESAAEDGSQAGETVAEGMQAGSAADQIAADSEAETESGEQAAPAPWDCIKDQKLSQHSFAEAGFPAAALTQYIPGWTGAGQTTGETEMEGQPGVDRTQQGETGQPGVDRTSEGTVDEGLAGGELPQAIAETEADGQQVLTADPSQIAHVSNIVARALSGVMNNS